MATVFKILYFPHVLLRKKSTPIEKITGDLKDFAVAMSDTMYAFEGIGLAAPQVGILKRFIVVDIGAYLKNESLKDWHGSIQYKVADSVQPLKFPLMLVNPEIVETEGEIDFPFDGCLSFPGVAKGDTKRHRKIKLRAKNVEGENLEIVCDGIMSICLQHELDHLEGVLFIDHLRAEVPNQSEIVAELEDEVQDPSTRKRLKKLKLVDARSKKYEFIG